MTSPLYSRFSEAFLRTVWLALALLPTAASAQAYTEVVIAQKAHSAVHSAAEMIAKSLKAKVRAVAHVSAPHSGQLPLMKDLYTQSESLVEQSVGPDYAGCGAQPAK